MISPMIGMYITNPNHVLMYNIASLIVIRDLRVLQTKQIYIYIYKIIKIGMSIKQVCHTHTRISHMP
jgi:hypothetical protein